MAVKSRPKHNGTIKSSSITPAAERDRKFAHRPQTRLAKGLVILEA